MKKIIFSATMIALFAFGVSGYVIKGTFEDVKEGLVYLKTFDGGEWKYLDSVAIQDGQFEFRGPVEKVTSCYLELKDQKNFSQFVFVENGTITVKGKTEGNKVEIGGTRNNDALNAYFHALRPVTDEIMKVMKDARETWEGGDTTRGDYYGKLFIAARAKHPVVRNAFAEKYKNTDFGVYLLTEMAAGSSVTAKQIDSLVALAPAEMKGSPYYAKLQERLEKVKASDLGIMAMDIELPTPQGELVALSSLRGKYVLLDFWASWCGPCRAEIPTLIENYRKYQADGFEIYSVSLDNQLEAWTKAIAETGMAWLQVSDLKGMKSPAAKQYNVSGIPATWLLDKEGKIIAKNLRGIELGAKLKEIFGH